MAADGYRGTRLRSCGAGLLSQAIPSLSASSRFGSLGSALSTACAPAWLLKFGQLNASPRPRYSRGLTPPGAGAGAAAGVDDAVAVGRAGAAVAGTAVGTEVG
jgi:hypothetical protein